MNNFVQAGTDRLLAVVTSAGPSLQGPSLLLVLYKVALYQLAVSAPKTRSRDGCVFQRVAGRPSHRRVLTKPLVQMVQCANCASDMFRLQLSTLMQCCALSYMSRHTTAGTMQSV